MDFGVRYIIEEHLCTLTSIIINRLPHNQSTYCCFVEMHKAFDWVDRDLLFYKLLTYNKNGFIYKCIKLKFVQYSHPLACIKLNDTITDWLSISSGYDR